MAATQKKNSPSPNASRSGSGAGSSTDSEAALALNEKYFYNMSMTSDNVPLLVKKKTSNGNGSGSYNSEAAADGQRGITLAWQDLSVYVPASKSGGVFHREKRHKPFKRVINAVSGIVYPGSFVAVLGASGAGKTTLVNVLANRAPGNVVVDGEITVNGVAQGRFMRQLSGYVYQDDLFTGTLTVLEHLTFMARMKLDRRLSSWERKRRVEELLVELGLKKCENTRIGIPGQVAGISGGERKRLAFASEIISGCPLLFTDEPTTGLDSFSAQKIVGMMRNMAAKGKTIICTIHQPNSQVFSMFDQLLLMAEGRTAYFGPACDAPAYMAQLGFKLPQNYNPADFYIRTLAVIPGKAEESRKTIREICDSFAQSDEAKSIEEKVKEEVMQHDFLNASSSSLASDSLADHGLLGERIRRPFYATQLYWLIWRSMLDSGRNPRIHIVRTIQKIVLAFLIGFCFFGVTLDQKGIQDIQGAVFVFITESTFPSMYGVIHVFPYELPLFLRENKSGLYRTDTYYFSKVISLLPAFILEPTIFVTIAYWLVGLRATYEAFFITIGVVILTANTAAACGCFFSAAFDSISVAITALIPFDYMLMITGGLFINLSTLPAYIAWAKFISWFMYANEALSVAQWKNITNIECAADPTLPCITTGAEVLATKSFNEGHFFADFIGLICLYTIFHLGAYLSLIFRSRRQ
ncbi:unnamed protein product [Orchesella dallaii]|uniref:ABC transporter domain-containing protein n=1 Tax=Orchesella dallaii TaxID=48710 RepID=A0ABP1S9B3_9HEXA